ncbi:MAG: peptide/nickel transport system permease protein [Thermomicrobiales bacterium]|jgi:peptide/nickel transport system permease protein|nr:peptide/nickel transport system permease protein [Thermomicrobiales bacterium]MEA2531055.1 peptide/nickel transport system permease protein [Thermomicrobiales bacterium]MEA2595831.1 peptide/nickel transport system permease protein [Thermomicrobiales bacterium]
MTELVAPEPLERDAANSGQWREQLLTPLAKPQSQLGLVWRGLRRDKFALLGGAIVLVTLFLALAAPILAPQDPLKQNSKVRLSPIGTENHLLGTDGNGRDMLSRLIYGSRTTLLIATVPVLVAAVLGLIMGLVAGYVGGWVDSVLMRLADILFAFPAILLAIAIVAALGPRLLNAMMALAIVFIPAFARLVRASVLSLRNRDYVLAAQASGATGGRIIARHILVNALPTIIVFATLQTGQMIIFGAALSFLGLGVQPPTPDWGKMADDGRNAMLKAPWVTTLPGIAIFIVSVGFNLLGDGLRDALDPTLKV